MKDVGWTKPLIEKLRNLVASGKNTKEILLEPEFQGRTKNSIVGMCYREKIVTKKHKPKRKRPILENNRMFNTVPSKPRKTSLPSLLSAKDGQCRFIIGEVAEDGTSRICGFPVERGSYCHEHYRITHNQ